MKPHNERSVQSNFSGRLALTVTSETWPLLAPFRIAGHTFYDTDTILVSLSRDGHTGHGEASGVFYRKESPASMMGQIEARRAEIEAGVTRESLQTILAPGGARNALDCALWDLEAQLSGRPAWEIADLEPPRPLVTTFTCGVDAPERMGTAARHYADACAIKIKISGDG